MNKITSQLLLGLLLCLFSSSVLSAQLPHVAAYDIASGTNTVNTGDIDGDGFADLLGSVGGTVNFISGIDGSLIRSYSGSFGETVGDITGDGIPDSVSGRTVRSGTDGSILFDLPDSGNFSNITSNGAPSAAAGDVNGDGVGDIIRRSSFFDSINPYYGGTAGGASIFSGADGSPLLQTTTPTVSSFSPNTGPFSTVVSVGDVNSDGVPDFAGGFPSPTFEDEDGVVDVFSGSSGGTIYTLRRSGSSGGESFSTNRFGSDIVSISDLDGDGVEDIIVGSDPDSYSFASPEVNAYSGATGRFLFDIVSGRRVDDLVNIGDVNGDGFDNLVIETSPFFGMSSTILYSGANLQESLTFDDGGNFVSIGDLDGDGLGDFINGNTVFLSDPAPVKTGLLGDVNLDGIVNFFDIAPFISVLSAQTFQLEADIDGNDVVNFLDIAPFIAILSGQ